MKKVMLSKRAHAWLNLLLMDETIRQSLMMDQEVAKRITILDDGSVRLDKHKSKFLNWMFNEGRTISFIEVVFLMLVLKIYEKYKFGDMTKEECKKLLYGIFKCFLINKQNKNIGI